MKEVLNSLWASAGSLKKKITKLINIYNWERGKEKEGKKPLFI
jgi:hypothetical protein